MPNSSHKSGVPDTKVDLGRFLQYVRIANVITHLLLPDDLIIDSRTKHFFVSLKRGYSPYDAIRYLVWHFACGLYARALMDKSFFLAGHKHLDICNDTKKIIELLHTVENFDTSFFHCETVQCRVTNRKFRQVAYETEFSYYELDLSTTYLKETFTITQFFWGSSPPQYLRGNFYFTEIEKNKRTKRLSDLIDLATKPSAESEEKHARQSKEKHTPFTLVGIKDANLIGKGTFTSRQNFNSTLYPNLIFPSMIDKIGIRFDEDFIKDIRRGKASIIEKKQKKYEAILDSLLDGFGLDTDKVLDFLNSPFIMGLAAVASISALVLSFLGIDAKRLARIAGKIVSKKPKDELHVKISPDGESIYLKLDHEVILELHNSKEVIVLLGIALRLLFGK